MSHEIDELLAEVRGSPPVAVKLTGNGEFLLRCSLSLPKKFDKKHIETTLNIQLPYQLTYLWEKTGELRLFEDTNFGQWGLIIWPANKLIRKNHQVTSDRPKEYLAGDLVVGEFLGDEELAVLRCDPALPDYGSVLISLPVYPRQDWYKAANSLIEFLQSLLSARGAKYWENR